MVILGDQSKLRRYREHDEVVGILMSCQGRSASEGSRVGRQRHLFLITFKFLIFKTLGDLSCMTSSTSSNFVSKSNSVSISHMWAFLKRPQLLAMQ
jgi:hypothetical protein